VKRLAAPALSGICHVHVLVADRAAATAWYRRVLGFEVMPEVAHWAEGGGPLTLTDAAGSVHLALFERPPLPTRSTVALRTDAVGLASWRRHLARELGHEPALEDHAQSLSLYFNDPDGNPYEITTYEVDAARAALGAAAG
jgi:catechol-2,3-dioxygenase